MTNFWHAQQEGPACMEGWERAPAEWACRLCRTGGACGKRRFAPQQHRGGGAHSKRRYVHVPQQHRAGGAHIEHIASNCAAAAPPSPLTAVHLSTRWRRQGQRGPALPHTMLMGVSAVMHVCPARWCLLGCAGCLANLALNMTAWPEGPRCPPNTDAYTRVAYTRLATSS